jgi:hypothetical protein
MTGMLSSNGMKIGAAIVAFIFSIASASIGLKTYNDNEELKKKNPNNFNYLVVAIFVFFFYLFYVLYVTLKGGNTSTA